MGRVNKTVCPAPRKGSLVVEGNVGWKGLSGCAGGRSGRRTSAGIRVRVRGVAGIVWRDRCGDYEVLKEAIGGRCGRVGVDGGEHRPGFVALRVGIWVLNVEDLFRFFGAALSRHLWRPHLARGKRVGWRS
jgi:hypothetical protein